MVGTDGVLADGTPQIAFIGRSNVGKSSVINSLTNNKGLAKTSSFPGLTTEINVFLINDSAYFIDLPGYGYAKLSKDAREKIFQLINWYLFNLEYKQKKVVLIIDAFVGPTEPDLEMLQTLESHGKNIVVVANKIDKIKSSLYSKQFKKIREVIGPHKIIPYSAENKKGVQELIDELLK